MNWNQFIEADRQECVKDAITSLQDAMTSITEALESLEESNNSIKSGDLSINKIDNIKIDLVDTQDKIENRITVLEAILEALNS